MSNLIDADGNVSWGISYAPVQRVNLEDYPLKTPMGKKIPGFLKSILSNQFLFVGVINPRWYLGMAIVDLGYAANGFCYVADRESGIIEEWQNTGPGWRSNIHPSPDACKALFRSNRLTLSMNNGSVSAMAPDLSMDLKLDFSNASPLRVTTRSGYRGMVYTQKTTPLPTGGSLRLKSSEDELSSEDSFAIVDWTSGFMRRQTYWNWASTATRLPDGRTFGLNLSCGVNETGVTENAFWIDGRMTKLQTTMFKYNPDNLMEPWKIKTSDGLVDLVFTPELDRCDHTNAVIAASKFTQLMGQFSGVVKTDDGTELTLSGCPGWTEDHYAKW